MGAVWGSQEDTKSAVGAPRECSVASGMGRQYVQALTEEQGQDKLAGLSLGAAQMMIEPRHRHRCQEQSFQRELSLGILGVL